jgi:hypothetical protein
MKNYTHALLAKLKIRLHHNALQKEYCVIMDISLKFIE